MMHYQPTVMGITREIDYIMRCCFDKDYIKEAESLRRKTEAIIKVAEPVNGVICDAAFEKLKTIYKRLCKISHDVGYFIK